MQRDAYKRPFTLTHQRFVVEVDPSKQYIRGVAELTIQPLNDTLTSVRINSKQSKIEKVFVNDSAVEFEYTDAVADLSLGANTTIAHHQVYKTKYLNALRDNDEGELNVKLPPNLIKKVSEGTSPQVNNTNNTNNTPQDTQAQAQRGGEQQTIEPTYSSLTIRIHYSLKDPRNGVVFVQRDDEIAPYRSNHVYTVNQPLPGATRAWLPCIDTISDRCTWDMEFIVPRKDERKMIPEYDGEGAFDEVDGITVVCSGEILEQIIHPTNNSKKIVHYRLSEPTPAPFIGFAIGPFKMIKLSPSQLQEEVMNAADLDENQQQSLIAEINMMSNIYAFALPGSEEELSISCSFLMHAMHFYTQEYGSYPFSDYKIVFVEDAWSDAASSASLSICSSRLLHTEDIIDQIYNTRRELSQALARQWFGIYIVQKSWPDTWLVRGIANLMGSLFIKRHLGNNEYRLRLKKDMELCCQLDVNRPPVYNQTLPYPLDPEDLDFIDLKAPLVIYMLDKRMCKGGGTLGLSRVLPKILVSAMSGELAQNAISTHYFLRLCRKVSGFDTKLFAEQWIYKSGCPKFSFKFHFNRKKMVVEIHMSQENTNAHLNMGQEHLSASADGSAVNYQELMNPLFTGNLTVRIHEADGTPYEHILDIQSPQHKFEVQFNTKYKRIRRNTKRFLAKQAAAAAAVAEEEQENEEGAEGNMVLGIIPSLGLGMSTFEDPSQKREWRIVEWGQDEEDTSGAASAMFDWIRLDAEFEWLCVCDFMQPDYMWAAQLTKDRDVVAQHEAIEALTHMPSLATSTSFLRAVLDPKCFYKIRMEATYGLAACAREDFNWVGLHQLNKMFHTRYCFPVSQQTVGEDELPMANSIPKPNNFSSLPDYFLQKASVVAFSQIRDRQGLVPVRIRQFLLDLLKYNDNIGNEFSDCYYVATLISALGDALIPLNDEAQDSPKGEEVNNAAKHEIERFRTLDLVIPSYHNIITVTCLRTMTKLMLKRLLPVDMQKLLGYTRYGNYLEIRLTAFDSLFILCGLSDPVLNQYLLHVIKEDQCVYVSHYVARAMLMWLGLGMKENADTPSMNGSGGRFVEEFAEEEGRVVIDDERIMRKTPQQEFQTSIENLRKRFENDTVLQQNLWDLLNSAENAKLDHCIRKYLLQFCEYMFKPIDVGLKVTIRVPTLPPQNMMNEDTSEPPTPTSATSGAPIIRLTSKHKHKSTGDEKHHKHKKIKTENLSQDIPSLSSADTVSSPLSMDSTFTENETIVEDAQHQTIREPTPKQQPAPIIVEEPSLPSTAAIIQPSVVVKATPPKPKTKKVDSATAEELKKCRRVLNKITKLQAALPFTQAVDEVLDNAPGYYKAIKQPMDLKQIKKKVEEKEYTRFDQFEADVRLMLDNCFKFNRPGSYVYNEGQTLEVFLDKEVASVRGIEHEEVMQNMTIVESPATTPHAAPTSSPFIPPSPVASTNTVAAAAPTAKTTSPAPITSAPTTAPTTISPTVVIKPPKPAKVKTVTSTVSPTKPTSHPSVSPSSSSTSTTAPVASASTSPQINYQGTATPEKKEPVTEREKMKEVLGNIMATQYAFEFLRPVDPIKQGIPNYPEVIKNPMDLGTVKTRLKAHQYTNVQEMDKDIRLIFSNCYKFNAKGTYVYLQAKALEEVYEKEWRTHFGARRGSGEIKKPKGATPSVQSSSVASASTTPPPPQQAQPSIKIKPLAKPVGATSPSISATAAPAVVSKPPKVPKPPKATTSASSVGTNGTSHKVTAHTAATAVPEKAVAKAKPAAPLSTDPTKSDIIKKRCERVLKKLWELQESVSFRLPVDAVALGIPTYYEVIKRPMDLTTVQNKFNKGGYTSIWDLERDIRQIFWNCYGFNSPDSWVTKQCSAMEKFFNQVWSAEFAIPDALKGEDKRVASKVVNKLTLHDAAALFNEPVDTKALPDYTTIVKHPMDLRTIWEKLESGKYSSLQTLDSDIQLVFKNCFVYNVNNPYATGEGQKLQKFYKTIGKEMQARIAANAGAPAAATTVTPTASTYATKKRRPSSSPAPTKVAASLSTEDQPPAKVAKVSVAHTSSTSPPVHKKEKPRKPAVVKGESSVDYMDINPTTTTQSPIALVSPDVVKPPPVVKAPSLPKSPAAAPMAKSPSVSKPSPSAVSSSSAGVVHKSSGSGSSSSSTKTPPKDTMLHPELFEKLEKQLYKMMIRKESAAFLEPVDPVALGIPHYFTYISNPMDFGTMSKKLKAGEYKTVRAFESDMKLIFINCYTFNGRDHVLSKSAEALEAILNKDVARLYAVEEKLKSIAPSSSSSKPKNPVPPEIKKYMGIIKRLELESQAYYLFAAPVDAELLQIPTYHDIVRRPMDFGTIRTNISKNKYSTVDQLLRDVRQVFYNCYLFNLPDDPVTQAGQGLEAMFNRLCAEQGLKQVNVDMNQEE